jgi:hypothetical protein
MPPPPVSGHYRDAVMRPHPTLAQPPTSTAQPAVPPLARPTSTSAGPPDGEGNPELAEKLADPPTSTSAGPPDRDSNPELAGVGEEGEFGERKKII